MARTARDEELSGRKRVAAKLVKVFEDVDKGFENQKDRSNTIMDAWDAYESVLGGKQMYNGNSKIFVPIVQVAVDALKTRWVNQLFPQNGRHLEITADGGDEIPLDIAALLEHYIRDARLRTQVMPALIVNGVIEGQFSLYVDWKTSRRHVVSRKTVPVRIGGVEVEEAGEVTKLVSEIVNDDSMAPEVLHDCDVLVLPATADSIEDALEQGGSVTVVRRWSKAKIQKMIDDGDLAKEPGRQLVKAMSKVSDQHRDTRKALASVAGIRLEQGQSIAMVYETWTRLKVDGEQRLCRAFFCSVPRLLGCKLNPYWCDRVPVLSAPLKKLAGLFKGVSLIKGGVFDLQLQANDAINIAMDALPYHLAPLIAVDPERVARWESLVMDVGAVWPVMPDAIKEIKFSDVTGSALQTVGAAKAQIFEALGVNPSMVPHQTGRPGAKRNQAEVAMEQQVDILTTNDFATNIENEILTPFVERSLDYDSQFRDDKIRVKIYGNLGHRASVSMIEPQQRGKRYVVKWVGVEAARNAAAIQQMIAFLGTLRGIPPQMIQGYRINAVPVLTRAVESTFGASLGAQTFESVSALYSIEPEEENDMMREGVAVMVQPQDDDQKHLAVHMQLAQSSPPGTPEAALVRDHIQRHQMQMQGKAMAAQQQQQGGQQGQPGGRQQGGAPGGGRSPQPGAQPQQPRPGRGPAGAIPQDRMPAAGAVGMPRKT